MHSLQIEKYKQTEVLIYPYQYISADGALVSYPIRFTNLLLWNIII